MLDTLPDGVGATEFLRLRLRLFYVLFYFNATIVDLHFTCPWKKTEIHCL